MARPTVTTGWPLGAYAAIGSAVAIAAVYVLGPSLLPGPDLPADGPPHNKGNGDAPRDAVGLSNPGNDCFVNSILQALAGLPRLRRHLVDPPSNDSPNDSDDNTVNGDNSSRRAEGDEAVDASALVAAVLLQTLTTLTNADGSGRVASSRPFVRVLEVACNARLSRRQQDAQEFLQLVLERLQRERTPSSAAIGHPAGRVDFPFEGELQSHVQCLVCNFRPKPTSSSFVTLTLNVPTIQESTLDECFDGLLKVERIDDYACTRCILLFLLRTRRKALESSSNLDRPGVAAIQSQIALISEALDERVEDVPANIEMPSRALLPKSRIQKHASIARYPEVLAIHLSRSIFDDAASSRKNQCSVGFPEILVLGGFNRRSYRLMCLVTHRGGHASGHYITFRRKTQKSGDRRGVVHPEDDPALRKLLPMAANAARGSSSQDEDPCASHDNLDPASSRASTPTANSSAGSTRTSHLPPAHSAEHRGSRRRRRRTPSPSGWWRLSDESVRSCALDDVLAMRSESYLLFYETLG